MVRIRAVMDLAFTPARVDNRQLVYRRRPLAATKTNIYYSMKFRTSYIGLHIIMLALTD
jgi:hypothetical protein